MDLAADLGVDLGMDLGMGMGMDLDLRDVVIEEQEEDVLPGEYCLVCCKFQSP
jgi:hypothetical protein